jgi:hypothetical protein
MEQIQINLAFQWQPVFLREQVEYLFPMAISPFMRSKYRGPAVFKWDIYEKTVSDRKITYIGEAQELCPKRLYGYLNPSTTQAANKKVNAEFRDLLKEKLHIRLEVCQIRELKLGEKILGEEALVDKYIRRLIVSWMIVEHKQKGYKVMDL